MSQFSAAMTRASLLVSMLFGLLVGQPAAFAGSPTLAFGSSGAKLEVTLAPEAASRLGTVSDDEPEDQSGSGDDSAVLPGSVARTGVESRTASFAAASWVAPDERKPSANRARAPPSA